MGDRLNTGVASDEARAGHEPSPDGLGHSVGVPNAARYVVRPMTVKAAIDWVRKTHRHLPVIQGGLFATSVQRDGRTVAAGIAVNPARVWQGTGRVVIGRVAAIPGLEAVGEHASPACTMILGSLCRAAKALGYVEAWTYTLPDESGASLRAAGFQHKGETKGEEWDRPSRARCAAVSPAKKGRWMRQLAQGIAAPTGGGDQS